MKVYQPGGLGERQNTLQALTTSVTIREQRFQTLR